MTRVLLAMGGDDADGGDGGGGGGSCRVGRPVAALSASRRLSTAPSVRRLLRIPRGNHSRRVHVVDTCVLLLLTLVCGVFSQHGLLFGCIT